MKVSIEISSEVMQAVMNGKYVEGSLRLQLSSTGTHTEVGFRPYNRNPRKRSKDKLVKSLEHGWVKESAQRFKVFNSIPKNIGAKRVIAVLERETKTASEAVMDIEIINRV